MGERLSPYPLYMAEDRQEDLPEIDKDPQKVFEQVEIEGRRLREEKRRQFLKRKIASSEQLKPVEINAINFFNNRDLKEDEVVKFLDSLHLDLNFKKALVQKFCDSYTLRNYYTNPFVPELIADQVIGKLREHRPPIKRVA